MKAWKKLRACEQVLASYGHVRDLPAKSGSVQPEQDFAMLWEQSAASRPRLRELAAVVKQSNVLVLATDPDREGEAISWHIQEELKVGAISQSSLYPSAVGIWTASRRCRSNRQKFVSALGASRVSSW